MIDELHRCGGHDHFPSQCSAVSLLRTHHVCWLRGTYTNEISTLLSDHLFKHFDWLEEHAFLAEIIKHPFFMPTKTDKVEQRKANLTFSLTFSESPSF